jgi:hypothetical protein
MEIMTTASFFLFDLNIAIVTMSFTHFQLVTTH